MTARERPTLTARELKEAVLSRYLPPEWHVEAEVTLESRRLDLVALNLWAARRYRVVGFEIKASRGDWMRELANFQKAETWTAVCDAFYVVAPPKLVRPDELPDGWGLLELAGSRMMTRRHAAQSAPRASLPREVSARFIARLAAELSSVQRTARQRAELALRAEIGQAVREEVAREYADQMDGLREVEREYRELLAALGCRPHEWSAHERAMRAAAALVKHAYDPRRLRQQLAQARDDLVAHGERIAAALDSLPDSP